MKVNFNIELLEKYIADGYISKKKHPIYDLYIINYTAKTQYEDFWNDVTLQCRGLIVDSNYEIVARPFNKFFNLEQVDKIPDGEHKIYEKMDGSLGILYWVGNLPYIATRGSFESDQAMVAIEILWDKYREVWKHLDKSKTYLFEIIYPANRIVVDYGDTKNLILLAVIDNETGKSEELPLIGFPVVPEYSSYSSLKELVDNNKNDNREGFVLLFKDNTRLKVKFEEYKRLHRILTQVSTKTIWEYLKDKRDINELLDRVPDEFYDWVKQVINNLETEYDNILQYAKDNLKVFSTRKETAEYIKSHKNSHIMFLLLDGRSPTDAIWKLLKPKYERPFKEES